MSTTQTLETKTLIEAMESRAKEYRLLRDQFQELKTSFKDIVGLDDFKGRTADAVKGFYRAQIEVVDAWIDFIDLQEAFFKGIKGMADDEDLGGKTLVHLPFLESDLKNSESRARQMVDSQIQALEDIFSGISDIVSMEPNSTKRFDKHIDEATKKRKETKEKVENFDQRLLEFYEQSKFHENVIAGLISELYKASSQGGEVNPLYFNEDAYKKSDIHTAKEEAKEITANYISWQDELEKARELENRSFGEKTWDTICTFTGEVTGYYDMKRASTGVDPVTGEKLTGGQRATAAALAAAGFIPFVGWAGRAAKGGHAIYKTSKTFSAAENALDAYRTNQAFDILKTSERGLYGLASANGFSEFITGRDIFGNPISEEEQQAGFERALLLLPFKGKTANPVLGVRDDARVVSKGEGINFGKYSTRIDDKVKVIEKEDLPDWIRDSFTDGNYRTVITKENIKFYRTYGGGAKAHGSFVTTSPAGNRINAKIDTALVPDWKNTREFEAVIEVPKGQLLNIGRVEKQYTKTGALLKGDGDQILLPQGWPSEWIKDIRKIPSK